MAEPTHKENVIGVAVPEYVGVLNRDDLEPDNLPIAMPDGVISVQGSNWNENYEWHGIVDIKFAMDGLTLTGVLPAEWARDLRAALDQAIAAAEMDPETGEEDDRLAEADA